jgi:DnaK suppressor protein
MIKTNLLTQPDTCFLRVSLEREAAELRSTLRNRDGANIEPVAEECERISMAGDRDLTIERVDRASRRLRDVESALQRIREGEFGDCIDCDAPIPVRRLTAIPWASRCVRCQETADRRNIDQFPSPVMEHPVAALRLKGCVPTMASRASGFAKNRP